MTFKTDAGNWLDDDKVDLGLHYVTRRGGTATRTPGALRFYKRKKKNFSQLKTNVKDF